MKNGRGDGRTLVHTAAADIASGEFVTVNGVVGVASEAVLNGEDVTLFIEGEYEGPTTGTPPVGTSVDWNGTAWAAPATVGHGVVTKDVGGNVGWIKLTP